MSNKFATEENEFEYMGEVDEDNVGVRVNGKSILIDKMFPYGLEIEQLEYTNKEKVTNDDVIHELFLDAEEIYNEELWDKFDYGYERNISAKLKHKNKENYYSLMHLMFLFVEHEINKKLGAKIKDLDDGEMDILEGDICEILDHVFYNLLNDKADELVQKYEKVYRKKLKK